MKEKKIEETTQKTEGSSFGWGVLGFFLPIVGLILFLVWKQNKKSASKAAGIGAIIGGVISILTIILLVCSIGLFRGIFTVSTPTPGIEEKNPDDYYPVFAEMTDEEIDDYLNYRKKVKIGKREITQKMYTDSCGTRTEGQIVSLIKADGNKYSIPDGELKNENDDVYLLVCKNMDSLGKIDMSTISGSEKFTKQDYSLVAFDEATADTFLSYGNSGYGVSISMSGGVVALDLYYQDKISESESFVGVKSVYYYNKEPYTSVYLVTDDNILYEYKINWHQEMPGSNNKRAIEHDFDTNIDSLYRVIIGYTTDALEYDVIVHTSDGIYYDVDGNKSILGDNDFAEYESKDRYILVNKKYKISDTEGTAKMYFKNEVLYGFNAVIDNNNNYIYEDYMYIDGESKKNLRNRGKISNIYSEINEVSGYTIYYLQADGTNYFWEESYSKLIY